MAKIIRIQISVFVDKKIEVSSENIAKIMGQLKQNLGLDFLPSVLNAQRINALTGNIENIQDLSFFNKDNSNQLLLSTGRVDYTINFSETNNNMDIVKTGVKVIQLIMKNGNLRGNRLALNVDYLSDSHEDAKGFLGKDLSRLSFYNDKEIKEWSSRINAEYEVKLLDNREKLNVITDFTHEYNLNDGKSYIRCHSDINTLAEKSDMRFSAEIIDEFTEQAINIYDCIKTDLDQRVR